MSDGVFAMLLHLNTHVEHRIWSGRVYQPVNGGNRRSSKKRVNAKTVDDFFNV